MRPSRWCTLLVCTALAIVAPSPPDGVLLDTAAGVVLPADPSVPTVFPADLAFEPRLEPAVREPAPEPDAEEGVRHRARRLLHHLDPVPLSGRLEEVAETVAQESLRHQLDPELLLALIHTESSFRPAVRSRAGAVGLMQLLPGTARDVARELQIPWEGSRTLKDPATNIRLGAWYLASLREDFDGDLHLALSAYNLGPARVRRYLRRGLRPAWYAERVRQAQEQFLRVHQQVDVDGELLDGQQVDGEPVDRHVRAEGLEGVEPPPSV